MHLNYASALQASVVSQIRAEVAQLRAQLGEGVPPETWTTPPPKPVMPWANAPPSMPSGGGGNGNAGGVYSMRRTAEDLARDALDQVEQQLRANSGLGALDDVEVAHLEAENTVLR